MDDAEHWNVKFDTFLYIHICVCVCMYIYMDDAEHWNLKFDTFLNIHICVCVCVCVCIYIYIYMCVCIHMYNNVSNVTFQCSASSLNNTARPVCMTSLVTQGWQTRSFLHQSYFVSQHAGSPCYNSLTQTTDSTLCYWYRSALSATDQGYVTGTGVHLVLQIRAKHTVEIFWLYVVLF